MYYIQFIQSASVFVSTSSAIMLSHFEVMMIIFLPSFFLYVIQWHSCIRILSTINSLIHYNVLDCMKLFYFTLQDLLDFVHSSILVLIHKRKKMQNKKEEHVLMMG